MLIWYVFCSSDIFTLVIETTLFELMLKVFSYCQGSFVLKLIAMTERFSSQLFRFCLSFRNLLQVWFRSSEVWTIVDTKFINNLIASAGHFCLFVCLFFLFCFFFVEIVSFDINSIPPCYISIISAVPLCVQFALLHPCFISFAVA